MNGEPVLGCEIKFMRAYYPSMGIKYCAKRLGRTENAVRLMAWKHGIKRDTDALREIRVGMLIPGAIHVCYGG